MRIVKIITGVVGALVLIIGGLIIYLANLDLNAHKERIRAEAKAATGRDFRLDGDLDLKLLLSPELEIRDVGVSNAAWGSQPEMATVGLMAVEVRVLDLVFGRIDITKLRLSDVELLLETDAQGRGNWQFTPPTPAANDRAAATTEEADAATDAQALSLGDVDLRRLRVVFADGKSGARHRFNVDHLRLRGGQGPLAVNFALTADGRPVDLAGTLPPLAALGQPGSALPVKLAGKVDGNPFPWTVS
ncbi:MAG: AsmA family protein [Pseudomonadota bacterium]|nr:AsmA family protein [Pseudomonadota bacterium]